MVLVLAAGAATRGSKRWIDVGFFTFQPSEFGKVLFVALARGFLADRATRDQSAADAARRDRGSALVPILLVFVQPDIGTALVYTAALAAVLFVAGVRWVHLAMLGARALVVVLAGALVPAGSGDQRAQAVPGASPHRLHASRQRSARRDLQRRASRSSRSVPAGCAAAASRGATQTGLDYLPEHATDFAFASLAEQRGFFGASILLLLYLLIVWRALKIVAGARDLYCAIVAGGIAFMFLFQVFVNIGMTMGAAPITGIPLPFVSVGGSSLITNFLALGDPAGDPRARPARRRG